MMARVDTKPGPSFLLMTSIYLDSQKNISKTNKDIFENIKPNIIMDVLEKWFRDNGGYLHPSIQLAQDAEHGSHFRATASIELGSHVLTVPHSLAMSNLNAQVDDDFPVFRTHAQQFTVQSLGFFYLMAQWLNKDKSFWKPYLDILPSPEGGFETPMFYGEDDRQWLEGTDLHASVLGRDAAWKKYWEDGVEVMKSAGMDVTDYTW